MKIAYHVVVSLVASLAASGCQALVSAADGDAKPSGADAKPFFKDTFSTLDNWIVEKWEDKEVQAEAKDNRLKVDTQSKLNGVMVWCKKELPKDFAFDFDFTPLSKSGFFMVFFCARGTKGEDILAEDRLSDRKHATLFKKYVEGATACYHISFRRNEEANCNLRKNPGMNLLKQETLPAVLTAGKKTHVRLTKKAGRITLLIDGQTYMNFTDDGKTQGPTLEGGRVGLRQVYDSSAVYENVVITELK